ncbi:GNAT family N-acetyltransferase [Paenibacillus urinalis]|uniref:GNAT family N-acetyltransferase n=1 Tax=Paenibacillus urinalis TaxID=521520 RepID=A0ABY7X4U2_9BACL|nr:GNAT family N-acetyltransferase [Paenibacillus urinalis]WDH96905.1 GNAT family N-acetyltransferase [Paenibacillus urinalis]WDI00549.1 GNAT family N-acetyltransferase [Paenibacillus urinalis]
MYVHRSLEEQDLEIISSFPQTEKELKYVSPKFTYPLTPSQILQISEGRLELTVVLDQRTSEVVGYANIYRDISDESICWLGNVIVSPIYRGQGAAPYLIEVMLSKAKYNLGYHTVRLACHSTNSRGLAFYTKQGFKPFDIKLMNFGNERLITIHMHKELI